MMDNREDPRSVESFHKANFSLKSHKTSILSFGGVSNLAISVAITAMAVSPSCSTKCFRFTLVNGCTLLISELIQNTKYFRGQSLFDCSFYNSSNTPSTTVLLWVCDWVFTALLKLLYFLVVSRLERSKQSVRFHTVSWCATYVFMSLMPLMAYLTQR